MIGKNVRIDPSLRLLRILAGSLASGRPHHPQRSSALVIILAAVVLVSALVISLFTLTTFDRTSSRTAFNRSKAELLADTAAGIAMAKIGAAIDTGRQKGRTWASEPGRIHTFDFDQPDQPMQSFDLFSAAPGADNAMMPDLNNVNLNRADRNGECPIAPPLTPGGPEPTMKVGWINLLADPSKPAAKDNPVVGRIAYWVDDESCKVNVNTANGTKKVNTFKRDFDQADKNKLPEYYGFGTPSEISLEALGLAANEAEKIAAYAENNGFDGTNELHRVNGVPSNFESENRFNITHVSKSPDINMFGEPRIHLMPAVDRKQSDSSSQLPGYTLLVGPTAKINDPVAANRMSPFVSANATALPYGHPVTHIYPTSKQLPKPADSRFNGRPLPQFPEQPDLVYNAVKPDDYGTYGLGSRSLNFYAGLRIANYFDNRDLTGQANSIKWPQFTPGNSIGFKGKYTDRQLDSITLQILDVVSEATLADQVRVVSTASFMSPGFLSNEAVCGVGRAPKFTEAMVELEPKLASNSNTLKAGYNFVYYKTTFELMMPAGFRGTPWQRGYETPTNTLFGHPNSGTGNMNFAETSITPSRLLTFLAESGDPATGPFRAILTENNFKNGDPKAKPPTVDRIEGTTNQYQMGDISLKDGNNGVAGNSNQSWYPGSFHAVRNRNAQYAVAIEKTYPQVLLKGGFSPWISSGAWRMVEFSPLDSLEGNLYTDKPFDAGELGAAVIPFEILISPGPSAGGTLDKKVVLARVTDPLVNKFRNDWEVLEITDSNTDQVTLLPPANIFGQGNNYAPDGWVDSSFAGSDNGTSTGTQSPVTWDGNNPGYRAANGGDPLSVWMPRLENTFTGHGAVDPQTGKPAPLLTKMSRFPSVGALNFIRTGMMPDQGKDRGTPWRTISFSRYGQSTEKGTYPDWAMLDLFTVPFLPQRPYFRGGTLQAPRMLTFGGATSGRLNINNPKIPYPFADSTFSAVNPTPPQRVQPLRALLENVWTSRSYLPDTAASAQEPKFEQVTAGAAQALADAIANRAATRPFMLPGQIAELDAVDAYTYTASYSSAGATKEVKTRNDLVREVVGAITTQSNSYSVWVVAQTVKKSPRNKNYGVFEPGDTMTGEIRRRYLVERRIEMGKDGVPGNANNPGPDGIVNTEDDPLDDYHPDFSSAPFNYPTKPLPYRWQVLAVENVQ